jgi:hypothetical protein
METLTTEKIEIYHKDFNLEKKHNLDQLPEKRAIFGVFGIVNNDPLNCRYLSETANLRKSIIELYENPPSKGLKSFMQGAWIQMLVFELVDDNQTTEHVSVLVNEWIKNYDPKIDDEGEYPGYYDY